MSDTPSGAHDAERRAGLFASLRRLCATLIEIVQTRLELVVVEYEEERAWLRTLLIHGVVATLFFGLGLMVLTLFLVLVFWDDHRLLAVGAIAALYLLVAAIAWIRLRTLARRRPRFLSATIGELEKDRAALRGRP